MAVRLPGDTLSRSTTALSGPASDEIVHFHLETPTRVELGRVAAVLGSEDAPWLGDRAPSERANVRRFYCDLELHAGGVERAIFRKSALVGATEGPRGPVQGGWRPYGPRSPVTQIHTVLGCSARPPPSIRGGLGRRISRRAG